MSIVFSSFRDPGFNYDADGVSSRVYGKSYNVVVTITKGMDDALQYEARKYIGEKAKEILEHLESMKA